MKDFVKRLHSIQAFLAFSIPFVMIFPLFFIFLQRDNWVDYAFRIHHWWSKAFFFLGSIPFKIEYQEKLDPGKPYIFCPNHFSYLDIPTMVRNKHLFAFMGKNDLGNIPLFGFMYKRMHIMVDRQSRMSSYKAILEAARELDKGRSITIFPEGGIVTKDPPHLAKFKDGAFRLSIEKQVPIVPVTIPYNWIILPDDEKFLINKRARKVIAIFHEPIAPEGLTLNDIDVLKEKTYRVIEKELKKHNQPITGREWK